MLAGLDKLFSLWDLRYLFRRPPWDTGRPPQELVEFIESKKLRPCSVLDIGCGTGTSVCYLAARGFDATGVDISRVAIA